MKLSVVIITFNEEENIGRCIDSVRTIADEIIVVDSYSTDRTEEIVKSRNATFIQHGFEGHIEQKNWAKDQATHEWVLSLDADEAPDEQLLRSIDHLKNGPIADGYTMNRMTNYCGKWIKHGGWYPDVKLRLWNRHMGNWGGTNPHDRFIMQASSKVAHIKGNILHYSFSSMEEHDEQIKYFTDISARALAAKGKRVGPFRGAIAAVAKFIRDYLLRAGFLDGSAGFWIAWKSAGAKFMKYDKLRKFEK